MKLTKKCRQCRSEGKKLFLRGERCNLPKCSFIRRPYAPGKKQKQMIRISDYGKQLRAKQLVKRIYGLPEKQLKNYYIKATKTKGATGEYLLQLLEKRLDNVVYRLGFSPSRAGARQLVSHGKITVNNKRVNISSYLVRPNDIIKITAKCPIKSSKKMDEIPLWLKLLDNKRSAETIKIPTKNELMTKDIDIKQIVEFYSR